MEQPRRPAQRPPLLVSPPERPRQHAVRTVLVPERFRGSCPFGAAPREAGGLSRAGKVSFEDTSRPCAQAIRVVVAAVAGQLAAMRCCRRRASSSWLLEAGPAGVA